MPAARNQSNGVPTLSDQTISQNGFIQSEAKAILKKKLQYFEEEKLNQSTKLGTNSTKIKSTNDELFLDTSAHPMTHSSPKLRVDNNNEDSDEILIYDGQSNTSIAQTAKDQFAAALLRLQMSLDDTTKRLQAVESRVEDILKQQQRNQQQNKPDQANKGKKGTGLTLLYLGWPVLVFLAMRAIERRTTLGTTMASTASA